MKNLLVIILPVLMMMVGCSRQPVFYMPPSQNVPLLSQEKEFTASSSFLGAEAANGVDVKAAYAAGTHLGLVGGINAYFSDEGAGFFLRVPIVTILMDKADAWKQAPDIISSCHQKWFLSLTGCLATGG